MVQSLESLTVRAQVGTLQVTLGIGSLGGNPVAQCNVWLIPTITPAHASVLTSEGLWVDSGIASVALLPAMQRAIFQLMFVALYEHIKDMELDLGDKSDAS